MPDKVAAAYDNAILTANKAGHIQDEALAYERGGVFFKRIGDELTASRYLARAQQLYAVWGAEAKADLLRTQYASLVTNARRRRSFQSFKKRRSSKNMIVHVSPGEGCHA
uniref:Uncharacterized protein n=1 Tax=Trieres chinensis TaxID=1514140 RepID=A0A7S2EWD8_TRICV